MHHQVDSRIVTRLGIAYPGGMQCYSLLSVVAKMREPVCCRIVSKMTGIMSASKGKALTSLSLTPKTSRST